MPPVHHLAKRRPALGTTPFGATGREAAHAKAFGAVVAKRDLRREVLAAFAAARKGET